MSALEPRPTPDAVRPLPAAADAALSALDAARRREVETIRQSVLERESPLATCLGRIERQAGTWPGWLLVDLWSWVAYLVIGRNFRPQTTVLVYVTAVARFFTWTVATDLDHRELSPGDFDRWMQWLYLEHRNGPRHRIKQLSAVRNYYDWRTSRIGGRNCAAGVKYPNAESRMPRKYTPEQVRAMLDQAAKHKPHPLPVRDRAMILFLLATGARRHEVVGLNLADVELRRNTGRVRIRGKRQRERDIPIEGPVVDALRDWLVERSRLPIAVHPSAFFVGIVKRYEGRRLSTCAVEGCIGYLARQAGLSEWGVHRFRVTFATWLYDQGVGLEEIRIVMGHSQIETTRRYISISERASKTRLSSERQHQVLGTRNAGRPRWVSAALGGSVE